MKKRYIVIILAAVLVIACVGVIVGVSGKDFETLTGWQRTLCAIVNREKILNTEYVGTVSDYTWSEDDEYRLEDTAIVMKDPDKDFVIMNVSDLHMCDYSQDAVTNIRNLENIRRMAQELQPDMITLSGDIFWTRMTDGTSVYSAYRLTEFMDSLEIPWAPIFGNHDYEGNSDMNYLADVMMSGEYCLMQKGDPSMGVGNYVVNVCEQDGDDLKVVHSVILMDSHNGNLWDNQVAWYKWAAEGVNELAGERVASSVVIHVPFAQYAYAYDAAWDGENNCWREGFEAFGVKGEEQCLERDENDEPVDNGFFAVIQEVGTTKNVICGHDHANTYSVLWEGVRLTYSLRLGYGAYFESYNQGVTTLTFDSQGNAEVEHHFAYPQS